MNTDQFSTSNSIMITNSLLQLQLVTFASLALLLSTFNDYVWGFSLISFCGSLFFTTLLVASYETDYVSAGKYFYICDLYNNLARYSVFSLLGALVVYAYEFVEDSIFRKLSVIVCAVFVGNYLFKFMIRDKRC